MSCLRPILIGCIVLGIVAPRMLVPCCGAEDDCCAAQTESTACCESPLVADSNHSHDSAPHHHPAPHSCSGCGLICCAKVVIPGSTSIASLLLAQTDMLPGASDTVLSRLTADGIFRPPRILA